MKRINWLKMLAQSGTIVLGLLFWGVVIFMLAGCEDGARAWTQAAADTRAGCQAAPQITDPAARLRLYDAIGRNVLALTDDMPLPKPTQAPAEIAANATLFIEAAARPVAKMTPAKDVEPVVDLLEPLKRDCGLAVEWGAIIGVLGTILWGVSLFVDPAALAGGFAGMVLGKILGLSFIWRLLASLGAVAVAVGAAGLWALDHPWIIACASAASLAWAGLVHHKDLAEFWHRILGLLHATIGRLHAHAAKVTPPAPGAPPQPGAVPPHVIGK